MSVARTALKYTSAAVDTLRRPPPGLVVLIYHRVGRRSAIEVDLPQSTFADQMAFLAAETTVVTLSEGLARLADPTAPRERLVAVTFDDGTADFADEAVPVLVEHGVPATLYIATDFLDQGRPFPDDGVPLSWAALADAASTGVVDVGSHTHTHALLDRLAVGDIASELDRSIELIAEHVGPRARALRLSEGGDGLAGRRRGDPRTVRVRRDRREPASTGTGTPTPTGSRAPPSR